MVAPGQKWPHPVGSWVWTIEIRRNISKNLLLQNCLAEVLKIWDIALPSCPLPSSTDEGPGIQNDPMPGDPGCEP